ncbi:epimerase [Flindersiella endophytica]
MRWVIAGSSGFLGQALAGDLGRQGHEVIRLVRHEPSGPGQSPWDPARGVVDKQVLADADVVVNLAGASVGRVPWTERYKRKIRESRTTTTGTLANTLAELGGPKVFVSMSAIGYYGKDRSIQAIDEHTAPGTGFLPETVRLWEECTRPAERAGARVLVLRTGVVLGHGGGVYPLMSLPFRFGLGAKFGSGKQYMGMIGLADWLAAVRFVVGREACAGPYNLTLPQPPTNTEFTRALGRAFHRPAVLGVPAVVLRAVLGGFSDELLGSARIFPRRLTEAGFEFESPDVEQLTERLASRA